MKKIPNKLKLMVKWSKKEKDFIVFYPRSADGHFMHYILSKRLARHLITSIGEDDLKDKTYQRVETSNNPNIAYFEYDWIKDLGKRGYDLTTLKFEIAIKKEHLQDKFDHIWNVLTEKERKTVIEMGFVPPVKKES